MRPVLFRGGILADAADPRTRSAIGTASALEQAQPGTLGAGVIDIVVSAGERPLVREHRVFGRGKSLSDKLHRDFFEGVYRQRRHIIEEAVLWKTLRAKIQFMRFAQGKAIENVLHQGRGFFPLVPLMGSPVR